MIRCLVALSLASALCLTACKQGAGERCVVNSDCDDDLLCILAVGATPQTGGTCEPNSVDMAMSSSDHGTPDLSTID